MTALKIWTCKIGEVADRVVSDADDSPMRRVVIDMYEQLTGEEPKFIFSGWDGMLSVWERQEVNVSAIRNNAPMLLETTDASVWAREFIKVQPDIDEGLMLAWFANAIERGRDAGATQVACEGTIE